jgi:origin recognition complex subunit 4
MPSNNKSSENYVVALQYHYKAKQPKSRRTPVPHSFLKGRELNSLMTRAVHGESNSVLLLGGPGSAKSEIVTAALDKLKQDHPETGSFYTIRLDGQIQTDDKIALREIARQLALEMNIETEKVSPHTQ